jgi:hypothetical protein
VADRQALKGLAEAAKNAAAGGFGFETIKLYSADGHEYELIVTSAVGEEEWQTMESHYAKETVPTVSTIQDYQDLKQELKVS